MNKLEECATALKAKVPLGYGMTPDEAREYARAVIRCLMEPSEGMIDDLGKRAFGMGIARFKLLAAYRAILQSVLDGKE